MGCCPLHWPHLFSSSPSALVMSIVVGRCCLGAGRWSLGGLSTLLLALTSLACNSKKSKNSFNGTFCRFRTWSVHLFESAWFSRSLKLKRTHRSHVSTLSPNVGRTRSSLLAELTMIRSCSLVGCSPNFGSSLNVLRYSSTILSLLS